MVKINLSKGKDVDLTLLSAPRVDGPESEQTKTKEPAKKKVKIAEENEGGEPKTDPQEEKIEEMLSEEQVNIKRNILLKIADVRSLLPGEKKFADLDKLDLPALPYPILLKVWDRVQDVVLFDHPRKWHLRASFALIKKLEELLSKSDEFSAPGLTELLRADPEFSLRVQLWSLISFNYTRTNPYWSMASIVLEKYMLARLSSEEHKAKRSTFLAQKAPDSIFLEFQKL